jgi:heme/copper-type cytochrome/quinol oxidase subunit 3
VSWPPRRLGSSGPPSRAQLGLIIVLVSISVVFLAACAAVLITRHQVPHRRVPAETGLPQGIVASTLLLIAISASLHSAVGAIRRNRLGSCGAALKRAGGLAFVFVALQALNCRSLITVDPTPIQSLYLFSVYLLIGLHAAHVIGGLVPIAVALGRVSREEYSSSRHEGLRLVAQYWHYLGAAWVLLLATLLALG